MRAFFSRIAAIILFMSIPYFLFIVGDIEAGLFLHINSIALVVIGSLGATLASYDFVKIFHALLGTRFAFFREASNARKRHELVFLVSIAQKVKETGGLACLDEVLERKDFASFIRYGLELLVSGYSEDHISEMLDNFAEERSFSRRQLEEILRTLSVYTPAFGMIGTVLGLIVMLANLSSDAGDIGNGLSLALLTTLYGAVLSNMIFRPATMYMVEQRILEEHNNVAFKQGLLMIRRRSDPYIIQDYLNSYLPLNYQVKDGGA